ncbi:TIGR03016 family PEP-CTERM system-associated outer membrane protein [Rubrivivax sp. RP6-9]|uniref:TIGR03016 family PEP-CTERM system-associated outer membrane protein n=1 Tax=Rubrivivax sp. RP6-9 TaxID=3415750 RepID=UPI003CC6D194
MQTRSAAPAARSSPLHRQVPWLGAALLMLTGSVQAQDAAGRGLVLTPTFAAETGFYETRGRTVGENGREGIVRLSPGFRLDSRSGRVRGSMDYAGSLLYRAGRAESAGREFQNTLSANFLAEAVTNLLYLDARASISQQAISAFGQQSVSGSLQSNDNRTEVSTVSLTPYLRGSLGIMVDYEARVNVSATDSRADGATNSQASGGALTLQSPRSGAMFGWALSATQQRVEYSSSTDAGTDNSQVSATVVFAPGPDLRWSLSGGRESADDGVLAERREASTASLGFQWTPSPRTSFSADVGERYFGRTNRIAFSHRSARTIWSYALVRDTTTGADGLLFGQPMTLFQLYYDQAASAYPDPAVREQVVLDQIAAQGQDPNQLVAPSFQTSSYSLQRRQDLSVVWLGRRTNMSLQAYTISQSQIVTIGDADPLFGEPVRQHGYASSVSYRLTPTTSVSAGGSRLMTYPTTTQARTDLKSANLGLTSQLGRRTSGQLGARYTVFNSSTDPYRETSVTASLNLRF